MVSFVVSLVCEDVIRGLKLTLETTLFCDAAGFLKMPCVNKLCEVLLVDIALFTEVMEELRVERGSRDRVTTVLVLDTGTVALGFCSIASACDTMAEHRFSVA